MRSSYIIDAQLELGTFGPSASRDRNWVEIDARRMGSLVCQKIDTATKTRKKRRHEPTNLLGLLGWRNREALDLEVGTHLIDDAQCKVQVQ